MLSKLVKLISLLNWTCYINRTANVSCRNHYNSYDFVFLKFL